jgi:hypothetical protein
VSAAQLADQPALPLVYLGDDTFGAAFDATLRLRVVREDGRVARVALDQRGHTLEAAACIKLRPWIRASRVLRRWISGAIP